MKGKKRNRGERNGQNERGKSNKKGMIEGLKKGMSEKANDEKRWTREVE